MKNCAREMPLNREINNQSDQHEFFTTIKGYVNCFKKITLTLCATAAADERWRCESDSLVFFIKAPLTLY